MNHKRKWWRNPKHWGIRLLVLLFNPDRADLIRLARPYKRLQSKATRKGHVHQHRPAGSKMFKRYRRDEWNLKYKTETE